MKKLNMRRRMKRLESPVGLSSMVGGVVALSILGAPMETIFYGGVAAIPIVLFGDVVFDLTKKAFNPLALSKPSVIERLVAGTGGVTVVDAVPVTTQVTLAQTKTVESVPGTKQEVYKRGGVPIVDLAPDCKPHLNNVIGRGILGVGMRGSGKSYFAARLIEEIAKFPIAQLIFDYKRDYITLPSLLEYCVIAGAPGWQDPQRGGQYWEVSKENAEQAGVTLLQNGLQVVLQLQSYESMGEAAEVMTIMLRAMIKWATAQTKKVPCLVLLDEAQQFLPQNLGDAKSNLTPEIAVQVFNAFEKINSVGRSLGFTPAFFTQRIAQLRKEVIGGSEIYFLMKQTMPQDLGVYEDIVGKDEKGKQRIDRRVFQQMEPGDGMIFEGGEMLFTHFSPRRSDHLSSTPGYEDAVAFYSRKHCTKSLPKPFMGQRLVTQNASSKASTTIVPSLPDIPTKRVVLPMPPTQDLVQRLAKTVDQDTLSTLIAKLDARKEVVRNTDELEEIPDEFEAPETQVVAFQPTRRSSTALSPELQKVLELYQRGISYRDIGAEIGCKKDKVGTLVQELKRRKLV